MHFCNDELAVILMIVDRQAEHFWRYAKGMFYYTCYRVRCLKQRIVG